ncbi:hypothetical protein RSAG8_04846, partial [Rhizoctonia solani AG-8 WAC10335]
MHSKTSSPAPRIRDVRIYWDRINFSQGLTEPHLQDIVCFDSTIANLLKAPPSAVEPTPKYFSRISNLFSSKI